MGTVEIEDALQEEEIDTDSNNMSKSYVYLARCNDGTLYTGYTTDLSERLAKHNAGKGAHYTCIRRPVKIVYSEEFETKSDAMKREYQVKQLRKEDKERLISIQAKKMACLN